MENEDEGFKLRLFTSINGRCNPLSNSCQVNFQPKYLLEENTISSLKLAYPKLKNLEFLNLKSLETKKDDINNFFIKLSQIEDNFVKPVLLKECSLNHISSVFIIKRDNKIGVFDFSIHQTFLHRLTSPNESSRPKIKNLYYFTLKKYENKDKIHILSYQSDQKLCAVIAVSLLNTAVKNTDYFENLLQQAKDPNIVEQIKLPLAFAKKCQDPTFVGFMINELSKNIDPNAKLEEYTKAGETFFNKTFNLQNQNAWYTHYNERKVINISSLGRAVKYYERVEKAKNGEVLDKKSRLELSNEIKTKFEEFAKTEEGEKILRAMY